MDRRDPAPWTPDRAWADPFIATLALLIVLLVGAHVRAKHAHVAPPPVQVGIQGRLADLGLALPKAMASIAGPKARPRSGDPLRGMADKTMAGWDRAVLAVHAADAGDLDQASSLAAQVDAPPFRKVFDWAYKGLEPAPAPAEVETVRRALGQGYAANLLAARCEVRWGRDPKPFEALAEAWVMPRLAGFAMAGLAALALVLGGLAFGTYLAFTKPQAEVPVRFRMPGRALLIVLLGWFLTHITAGYAVGIVLLLAPFLRPIALPLTYAFHATLGVSFLCWAEGIGWRTLWTRLTPGRPGKPLLLGLGFLALAFTAVVAVSMAVSPFIRGGESPQRELMDLLAHTRGILPVACLFLTVAVLAPVFEELMFRGFMLPWLGERLEGPLGKRAGWLLAVAVTGLTFGAMHLQPLGMPTLGTLGVVLGFAFLRSGNLLTAILVHGLWNGTIFIVMRLLA
jgi:membrane protease YdiL (CAAX protease family)